MTTKRWELAGYPVLASRYQLIVLDTLGHGRSDRPTDAAMYDRRGVAADVIAVMDAVGVEKAHVWGYSRGGGIAANVATLYPERLRSLIMGGSLPNQSGRLIANAAERVEALRRNDWDAFWTSMGLSRDAQLEAALQAGTDAGALAAIIEASGEPDGFENDFAAMRDRMLVYAGSNDLGLGEKSAVEALEKRCSEIGARLELLEGLNHAEAFQRSDLVMPFVRDFLNKLP
jgi:pimeloyl-ACP methyl ester carboxylesterase